MISFAQKTTVFRTSNLAVLTSRLDTNRSDLTETPLAERQRAGRHRVAERHRVGRKTQLDKNAVYTNNEIGHKDKHGRIKSGGNKNVSGSKVTHKERERVA